jgi:hypothetical protein
MKEIQTSGVDAILAPVNVGPWNIVFYDTLKISAEYDRDTSSAKLLDISRQISPASLLGVC